MASENVFYIKSESLIEENEQKTPSGTPSIQISQGRTFFSGKSRHNKKFSMLRSSLRSLNAQENFETKRKIQEYFKLGISVLSFVNTMMRVVYYRFAYNMNSKFFNILNDKSAPNFKDYQENIQNSKKRKRSLLRKSYLNHIFEPKEKLLRKKKGLDLITLRNEAKKALIFLKQKSWSNLQIFFTFLDEKLPVVKENTWLKFNLKVFVFLLISCYTFIIPFDIGVNAQIVLQIYKINPFLAYLIYYCIKLSVIFEILVKINSSIIINVEECFNREKILKEYIREQFLNDFVAFLAIQIGFQFDGSNFFGFLIFIKFWSLLSFFESTEELINLSDKQEAIYRLINLTTKILFISHFSACLWHYIALNENDNSNWLSQYYGNEFCSSGSRYFTSLYWSITTITTVGYGDIYPKSNLEKTFSILMMLIGCGLFGYSLNSINEIIKDYNEGQRQYKETLKAMNRSLRRQNIPANLILKAKKYLKHAWKEEMANQKQSLFMNKLPSNLTEEIEKNKNKNVLQKMTFFNRFSKQFLRKLRCHIREMKFAPGDFIIQVIFPN